MVDPLSDRDVEVRGLQEMEHFLQDPRGTFVRLDCTDILLTWQLMNRYIVQAVLLLGAVGFGGWSFAGEPFSGTWSIDLRTATERRNGAECGRADFELRQSGDNITGSHSMATAGCGRLNERGAVRGVAIGTTAVLVVTSGRNGAVVMGTATLSKGRLKWRKIDEIQAGSPEGDSPLILGSGTLVRSRP